MGELVHIVYKPADAEPAENAYTRLPLQTARLVVQHGIEGDMKGGSPERQLNIMTAETVQGLASEGFMTNPGQLGEQLTVAGLDVDSLPAGTRLRIGETAQIEVTIPRTGCNRFEGYQGLSPQQAAGRLGVMAKVIAAGTIHVGDSVTLLSD